MGKKTQLNTSDFFKASPALVWQFLFFYLPLLIIIAASITAGSSLGIAVTQAHFKKLFTVVYWRVIGRSLGLALSTTLFSLLLAYPLAYYIGVKRRSLKNIFLFFLIVPFWTNFLVLTYAWFFVLDPHGILNRLLLDGGFIQEPIYFLNNYPAVILVMVYAYLPFMVMPIFTTLEKLDTSLIEASRDLGATMSKTFFNVILPLSMPGVLTGVLLVFVPAFGEFVIPMLVGGDKNMYVGSLISHLFFLDQDSSGGAAFTVLSSLVLFIVVAIISWFMREKRP